MDPTRLRDGQPISDEQDITATLEAFAQQRNHDLAQDRATETRILLSCDPSSVVSILTGTHTHDNQCVVLQHMPYDGTTHTVILPFAGMDVLCAWWLQQPQCTVARPSSEGPHHDRA